jgi:hypothetical protein
MRPVHSPRPRLTFESCGKPDRAIGGRPVRDALPVDQQPVQGLRRLVVAHRQRHLDEIGGSGDSWRREWHCRAREIGSVEHEPSFAVVVIAHGVQLAVPVAALRQRVLVSQERRRVSSGDIDPPALTRQRCALASDFGGARVD